MSAATGGPITLMETAGEGGAWGMAVLALYLMNVDSGSLSDYLSDKIFAGEEGTTITADAAEVQGFDEFMKAFKASIPIEKAAVDVL